MVKLSTAKSKFIVVFFSILLISGVNQFCFAEQREKHTDEFIYVSTYFWYLPHFKEISPLEYDLFIPIIIPEKNLYYSEEEVVNSDFMKQLKDEQSFISSMIRAMTEFTNSEVLAIRESANQILKVYLEKKDINEKAQEVYFYTKMRKFKPGLCTIEELGDRKDKLFFSNLYLHDSIYNILLPDKSPTLKITCEERSELLKQVANIKTLSQEHWHIGLGSIDRMLNLPNIPCIDRDSLGKTKNENNY